MKSTRRQNIILVIVLLLLLIPFSLFLFHGPTEPVYNGKPLSYWVNIVNQPPHFRSEGRYVQVRPDTSQAANALQHIGTNAIPFLIPMLRARDSNAKIKLMRLTDKIPKLRGWPEPAELRQRRAIQACLAIGPDAQAAAPAIVDLVNNQVANQTTNVILVMDATFAIFAIDPIAAEKAFPRIPGK